MKTFFRCAAVFLALMMLSGCTKPNTNPTESTPPTGNPTVPSNPTDPSESAKTGWVTVDGKTYYYLRDGSCMTGKVEISGKTYYFDSAGVMQTGWITLDNLSYYFLPDGAMAVGQVEIDGRNRFFTADGQEVLVVNPWNALPDGYDPDLITMGEPYGKDGTQVSRVCYEALKQMIDDCNKECPRVYIISSFRSVEYQEGLFENRIQRFQNEGYSREEAEKLAASVVARPGTSEHHTGLAVDIIDTRSWDLTEIQETLPGQQWLMANSWRYGFILRYPKDTIESTGIIYEPWHYRYVGVELATAVFESGLTLEEYFESLSQ